MRVQVEKLGQLTITAMPQLERFYSGVEPTLLFVEQTIEQEDSGFQFVRRNLQPGRIHQGGDGLDAAASKDLSAAEDRIAGAIEIEAGEELASDPALRDEVMERVYHYEPLLLDSVRRQPTELNIWMINRILNTKLDAAHRRRLPCGVSQHSICN